MRSRLLFTFPMVAVAIAVATSASADDPKNDGVLRLNLRTRVQPFKGSEAWDEVALRKDISAKETAIVICDMWDDHWCKPAAKRCEVMAKKMVPILAAARAKGVTIIHSPSECMDFYKDAPQRKKMQEVPKVDLPKPLPLADPTLPVDSSNGGCDDDTSKFFKAWKRQTELIPIAEDDLISDKGDEIYSLIKQRGIKNVIFMGVHANMCVLNRPFAIKQLTRWGVRCVLVRDLTDAMYDPKMPPKVSHDAGTDLVIQYIEKHWCPSILSSDLAGKMP
ncbi:MAG: cysteine hydrolase [Gemmataceae bacterium]|nr:cysteine hydrolase [Gemmataceae bacterium]